MFVLTTGYICNSSSLKSKMTWVKHPGNALSFSSPSPEKKSWWGAKEELNKQRPLRFHVQSLKKQHISFAQHNREHLGAALFWSEATPMRICGYNQILLSFRITSHTCCLSSKFSSRTTPKYSIVFRVNTALKYFKCQTYKIIIASCWLHFYICFLFNGTKKSHSKSVFKTCWTS